MKVKLHHIAHVRAGDKGNTWSCAVIAYSDELYPLLKEQLTAEVFQKFYAGIVKGKVERFPVDKLCAMNFVAHDALGGGASRTLALDNYGKAMSSAILALELEVPERLGTACGTSQGQPRESLAALIVSNWRHRCGCGLSFSRGFSRSIASHCSRADVARTSNQADSSRVGWRQFRHPGPNPGGQAESHHRTADHLRPSRWRCRKNRG